MAVFPTIDAFRLDFPLRSAAWTIWPDLPQTRRDWAIGHPLELRPFRWDFLEFECAPQELVLKPHYLKSTWDAFYVDTAGSVRAEAFRGRFRHTFGHQPMLLVGLFTVLTVLADSGQRVLQRRASALRSVTAQLQAGMGGRPVPRPPSMTLAAVSLPRPLPVGTGPLAAPPPKPQLDPDSSRSERLAFRFWQWKLSGD